MGLKILHSADWHLDAPFGSLPEANREQLKNAQRRIPGMIAELCIREQCDLVLLAGDLFDGKASRESVEALRRALERCRVPVLIAPGNHDYCAPGSPWLEERWPDNVYIFRRGLEALDIPALDCRVYGAGYQSMDCPGLLHGFRAEGDARYQIGLLHADPLNLSSPCCPVTAAQVRESGLDYLALGHIHRAGSFRGGSTLCGWPGCPMGRGWDETGEKGVYLVHLSDRAEIEQVTLALPRFFEITASPDTLDEVLPLAESPDLYRVTLTGTGRPDLRQLKKRYANLSYLELRDETQAPADIWAAAGEDSLRGVYFRILREQLEQADPEQAELIRLAAELSGQLLDGREVQLP